MWHHNLPVTPSQSQLLKPTTKPTRAEMPHVPGILACQGKGRHQRRCRQAHPIWVQETATQGRREEQEACASLQCSRLLKEAPPANKVQRVQPGLLRAAPLPRGSHLPVCPVLCSREQQTAADAAYASPAPIVFVGIPSNNLRRAGTAGRAAAATRTRGRRCQGCPPVLLQAVPASVKQWRRGWLLSTLRSALLLLCFKFSINVHEASACFVLRALASSSFPI